MESRVIFAIIILCTFSSASKPDTYRRVVSNARSRIRSFTPLSTLTDAQAQKLYNDFSLITPQQIFDSSNIRNLQREKFNITEKCANQTLYFIDNIKQRWALRMFDSWAKPERGVLNGNINWLGDYDECVNITTPANVQEDLNFGGQYCTMTTSLSLEGMKVPLSVGMCVPSGCDNSSLVSITRSAFSSLMNNTSGINVICADTDKTLDSAAIATIVIVLTVVAIALIATAYDLWLEWQKRQQCGSSSNEYEGINSEKLSENSPLVVKKHPKKPGIGSEVLLCFSLYSNGLKIISTEQPAGLLTCLHGIRFLSMTWVVQGHSGAFSALLVGNPLPVMTWIDKWTFQAIVNATVSVDTFFVLSGLLCAYTFLKDFERKKTTIKQLFMGIPKLYLHRYIRLTPAYAFAVLIWTCLVWYVSDGPLWPTYHRTMDDRCQRHWYLNFLYVNNLWKSDDDCLGWSWYLANDMQFFMVSPFIVYFIFRHAVGGLVLLLVTVLVSTATGVGIAYKEDAGMATNVLIPGVQDEYDDFYYYAPWCRFQSFGVGLFVGYVIWRTKSKIKIPKIWNLVLWLLAAAINLAVIYGPFDSEMGGHVTTRLEKAFYNSLGRLAWSVGVAWVIIACCTGNGGPVNVLLSWKGFIPLSKLTYCTYLLHPIGIWIVVRGTRFIYTYNQLTYVCTFLHYLALAFLAAFPFSLLFEAPIMGLDKIIFAPKKSQ